MTNIACGWPGGRSLPEAGDNGLRSQGLGYGWDGRSPCCYTPNVYSLFVCRMVDWMNVAELLIAR